MGNQSSSVDSGKLAIDINRADRGFDCHIHTSSGPMIASTFGEYSFQRREARLTCKGTGLEITEYVGMTQCKGFNVRYDAVGFVPVVLSLRCTV